MKTNVIHLEEYDNLASILEKISWAAPGRILLVFPERGQVLRNEIEFLQIIRKTQDRGANLAIVTRDYDLLRISRLRNISTFSNLRRAQRSRWKKRLAVTTGRPEVDTNRADVDLVEEPRREPKPMPQWLRIILLTAGLIAFVLIIATFVPSAKITLAPKQLSQEIVIQVEASEDVDSIGLTGSMPVHRFSVIVDGSLTVSTSGSAIVPDGIAKGIVTMQSTTSEDIYIPAGSVVFAAENEEVVFHTLEDVLLSIDGSTIGTTDVISQKPGPQANLPANSLLKLDGIYTEFVDISNPSPITGGSEKETKAADEEDINDLRDQLIADLNILGMEQITAQLEENDILLNNEITIQRILVEEYFPEQPTPSSELTLTMEIEFLALVVHQADMETLANMVLNANLPELYQPLEETLVVLQVNEPDQSIKGHYIWEIVAKRMIEASLDPENLKWKMLSQPINDLPMILEESHASADYGIQSNPNGWPLLPMYPFRIEVDIE